MFIYLLKRRRIIKIEMKPICWFVSIVQLFIKTILFGLLKLFIVILAVVKFRERVRTPVGVDSVQRSINGKNSGSKAITHNMPTGNKE
ncbi:hypothetical protein Tsp_08219 [Trichinella spiralis]|uniref:hypothetical protein n=1 Tax=Trichinella spiralis TaxID=6334 RepID=UPI0001EFEA53|nr:hypothetical protein Tsp_08219 [Trichinella spiralis]